MLSYQLHWYTSPDAFNQASSYGQGAPFWMSTLLAKGWRIQQIAPVQAAPGEAPGVLVLLVSPDVTV